MKKIEFNKDETILIRYLVNRAPWNKQLNPLYHSILTKLNKSEKK